jgi:CRISPR/Cas system-associated endonuclease Cas1
VRLSVPLDKVDQVMASGEDAINFVAIRALLSSGGGFLICEHKGDAASGWLTSANDSRIELRHTQHQRQQEAAFGLHLAQRLVSGKIANSRLCLRRLQRHHTATTSDIDAQLADMQRRSLHATSRDQVRGLEVHLGHLHAQRDGHAALVSDLMEEFRALVVDTVVLHLLQDETLPPEHSFDTDAQGGVRLGAALRKRLIGRLEEKLNSTLTHPLTGEKGDYRRVIRTQIGHYIQVLQGQAEHYQPFAPR